MMNACSTAPITDRRQFKIIPEKKLNAQAAKIYEKIKEKEEEKRKRKLENIEKKEKEKVLLQNKKLQEEEEQIKFKEKALKDEFKFILQLPIQEKGL